MDEAAEIMLKAAIAHAKEETSLERIVFVLYGKQAYDMFEKVINALKTH